MAEGDRREELLGRIDEIRSLASPPVSLDRILRLASDPEAGAEELAEAIRPDPAVTARVLRLANSAYFGFSRQVSAIDEAVMVVGFRNVRNVAACAVVAPIFARDGAGIDLTALWRHSCAVAEASRLVALHQSAADGPAYVAGLLHDLGQTVLSTILGEEYARLVEKSAEGGALVEIETKALGVDHAWAGSTLARRWKLPSRLVSAIEHHHDESGEARRDAARVQIGEHLARQADFGEPTDPGSDPEPPHAALAALGLGASDMEVLVQAFEERRDAVDMLYQESVGAGS